MKKIIVTGASGFIGRHCLPLLLARGYEVHAVCPDRLAGADPRINWHNVDLLDAGSRAAFIAGTGATHLLHFAWYVAPGKYWTSDENFRWVEASVGLMKEFRSHGGQRVVMAGTCAEYDWGKGCCIENVTPLAPTTVYGKCKNDLQSALAAFSWETGLSGAWGRIFLLYGPHEQPVRLVPSVITALLQGQPARVSHGAQVRDLMHVADVAAAFVALLESDVQGAVNIASGSPVSLKEAIEKIGGELGRLDLLRFGEVPAPKDEPAVLTADVKRLKEEVGWTPRFDLDRGLHDAIVWWREKIKENRL